MSPSRHRSSIKLVAPLTPQPTSLAEDPTKLITGDSNVTERSQVNILGPPSSPGDGLPDFAVGSADHDTPPPLNYDKSIYRSSPQRTRRDSIDTRITNIEFDADAKASIPEYHQPSESSNRPFSQQRKRGDTPDAPIHSETVMKFKPRTRISTAETKINREKAASSSLTDFPIDLKPNLIYIPPPQKIDKGTTTDESESFLNRSSPSHSKQDETIAEPLGVPLGKIIEHYMDGKLRHRADPNAEILNSPSENINLSTKSGYLSDSSEPVPIEFDLSLIEKKLKASLNPIADLYELFGHILPPAENGKLLKASLDEESFQRKSSIITKLFNPLLLELIKLRSTADIIHRNFTESEHVAMVLHRASGLNGVGAVDILVQSAEDFHRLIGELEFEIMVYDIHLLEFRVVFEKINVCGTGIIPSLIKKHAEFADAFTVFMHCQSKSVEFRRKLHAAHEFHSKITLNSKDLNEARLKATAVDLRTFEELRERYTQMQENVQDLTTKLTQSNEIICDLENELFEAIHGRDRTPSALLFFTALNDLESTKNLQQLMVHLKKLKGFVECKVHLDFVELRKQLQTCLLSLPYVERFLSNFKHLHQEWTKRRLALYEKSGEFLSEDILSRVLGTSKKNIEELKVTRGRAVSSFMQNAKLP